MIAHSPNSLCRQAELYYYDFLCDESRGLIPESMVNHIEQCQHCQEQIIKLKAVLSRAEGLDPQQGQLSSAVTTMLKLHFAHIGKPVTCNIVKPFLPMLLDPALGMRIPTPIVTHLCDCPKCSEDLDIIRCLNLNRKQLCRLSRLFAEKPAVDGVACSKAQDAVSSVASMVFSEADSEVLKHLCKCLVCRGLLYIERQKICDSLPEHTKSPEFPCESVSTTDIFDYVVPYGLDPASDRYAKFRKSFTSHVVTCPNCLAKMQTLHDFVYYIAERPESGVVTIYHVDESAKAKVASESDELYAGFPIRVEVMGGEDEVEAEPSAPTINFGAVPKQKVSAMNLKPLVKTVAAAAAIILIAAALLLNIPTAKAVTIEGIYKAIEKVRNVYISSFTPGKKEPIQEQWVSRALNIYITKSGKQLVLWDLPNAVRRIRDSDTAVTETTPLADDVLTGVEKKISGFFGLVPFYDISEIPADAEWSHVTDDHLKTTTGSIKVYDLTWTEKAYDGSIAFRKWRVFVDPETNLPQIVEWYEKLAADSEYTLMSMMIVEYLDDSEIRAVIRNGSF